MINKFMKSFKNVSRVSNLARFESFSDKRKNKLESIREFYFFDVEKSFGETKMAAFSMSMPCLIGTKIFPDLYDNFQAILFMLASSFIQSLVNFITKLLLRDYPNIGTTNANFFRGLVMMLLSYAHFKYNNIDLSFELRKNIKKTKILFYRSLFGVFSHLFLYESNKYMRISSAYVIFTTYPIFASMITIIYLKIKVTKLQIFTIFTCFFSVILISKPAFLFQSGDKIEDTSFGIFLAILSSLTQAFGTLLNKQIAFHFDVTLSTFMYGLLFSFCSGALGVSSGNFLSGINLFDFSFLLMLLLGGFYFYSLIYFVQALNIGDPIKILPFTYFGVIVNLFYNYFFFGGFIDLLDILGSALIVGVNIINNLMQLK